MEITKVNTIFFSPTGTSKKVVEAIAEGARGTCPVEERDLTRPGYEQNMTVAADELAVIGVPVYAGRVASLALERLQGLSGSDSPAILVVLYGNREFEDALIELRDILAEQAFSIVAACAFIGEHSFSSTVMPIGLGRPDDKDLATARTFGQQVMEQIMSSSESVKKKLQVPGKVPYKERMKKLPFSPQVNLEECTQCELCISSCPAGAILLDGQITIKAELCIFCCACIKNCPEEAVSIGAPPVQEIRAWLHANFQERKEPELFV